MSCSLLSTEDSSLSPVRISSDRNKLCNSPDVCKIENETFKLVLCPCWTDKSASCKQSDCSFRKLCSQGRYHILSIQSHVVRGYVGNRASVSTLQMMGHEVDFCDSVSFSSMYVHEGTVQQKEVLKKWWEGLKVALSKPKAGGHPGHHAKESTVDGGSVLKHDYPVLLSGYVADCGFLKQIGEVITELKSGSFHGCLMKGSKHEEINDEVEMKCDSLANYLPFISKSQDKQQCLYICDPAMGDNGTLYVPNTLVEIYQQVLIPLADVILPNEFELQWLDGDTTAGFMNLETCLDKMFRLQDSKGVSLVVVTSANLKELPTSQLNDKMHLLATLKTTEESRMVCIVELERLGGYKGGCGDVFASLLTHFIMADGCPSQNKQGNENKGQENLKERFSRILVNSCAAMQACMRQTMSADEFGTDINVVDLQIYLSTMSRLSSKSIEEFFSQTSPKHVTVEIGTNISAESAAINIITVSNQFTFKLDK